MSAYYIIGDKDTVLGFRFAGVAGSAVQNREEALAAFQQAIHSASPGVLILTEDVEDMLTDEVLAHRLATVPPYLATIRGFQGAVKTRKSLQEMIGEAVGVKLVSNK